MLELRYENLENLYCKFRNVSDNLKVGSTEIIFIAILQDLLEGTEAAAGVCSVKKVLLKISQNLQENNCASGQQLY